MGELIELDAALARVLGKTRAVLPSPEEMHAMERDERARSRERNLRDSGIYDYLPEEDIAAILWHSRRSPRLATDGPDGRAFGFVHGWLTACYKAQKERRPMVHFAALLGPKGRGKTMAAGYGLSQIPGRYLTARQVTDLATARYGEDRSIFRRLRRTGLLVIDEIGMDEHPDILREALHRLVDVRQGAKRRTLLMGNIPSAEALYGLMDPRTVDRWERSGVVEVLSTAPSMRGSK